MKKNAEIFKAGTRSSRLALLQANDALQRLATLLPGVNCEIVPFSSPGDRDRAADLRTSPADFFTRDLDEAVLDGRLDLALHSAKDLPEPMPAGLDWCWLPWREDARDALILAPGRQVRELPAAPVLGVSSGRREAWCRQRFPTAVLKSIRGNIEDRLAQLDAGAYDAIVMAGAALLRLGLAGRVTQWLSLDELPVPAGQGALAMTFRAGDPAMTAVRGLFVKAVRFVGAGVGDAGLCTMAGAAELAAADVCLYDELMDERLLELLPPSAERVFVGKRAGAHSRPQAETSRLLADHARRGRRVVRLKGGDPGLFGRLGEELEELEQLSLPWRVLPGVSSLVAATTGIGMPLTRRGVARGFTAMTPRAAGGAVADVNAAARASLPLVLFMAGKVTEQVAAQLLADGLAPDTPAAIVCNAGADTETVRHTSLGELAKPAPLAVATDDAPSLLIVGEIVRHGGRRDLGALAGRRVLLTCSDALLDKAVRLVVDFGGRPVRLPLIRLTPRPEAGAVLQNVAEFAAVVLTSPSAARCFLELLAANRISHRRLPCLIACGPGTAGELEQAGIPADITPAQDFGAAGLLAELRRHGVADRKILRLRSDKAGPELAAALRDLGAEVTDCVLYANQPVPHQALPEFDAVFFASASAVEVFVSQWSVAALADKLVLAIGRPTATALETAGVARDAVIIGNPATVEGAIQTLAGHCVGEALKQ